MKSMKTFEAFLQEADEKKPEGAEKATEPKGPSIDPDKEKMKDFDINGKTYKGILSTFEAIAKKQEAMGKTEVGLISLPGDESVYELYSENETKEE